MTTYDLILRNALIIDGTGGDPVEGDIAVRNDRIEQVGSVNATGAEELDLKGAAVSPGFIDVHTHDDFPALLYPDMAYKLLGGVTTAVVGNCGMGAAPFSAAALLSRAFHPNQELPGWDGYGGYLDYLDHHPASLNIAALAGHGTIRAAVMAGASRAPTQRELKQMNELLEEGLDAGVIGLSTGLIYEPGRHADTDEIVAMAEIMADRGGLYTTHMRDEGSRLLESLEEAVEIGTRAGVAIQISHHKAAGRENWGKVVDSTRFIESAQEKGIRIHADQYPYTAGSTVLSAVVQQGSMNPEGGGLGTTDAESIIIASTASHAEWEGKSIAELSAQFECSPQQTAERILELDSGTTVVMHSMSEEDVQHVMQHPSTMIGSDGIPTLGGKPHPRLYSTFARVLGHYSRELNLFPLQQAIHKMTGFPAEKFGFTDRGEIRQGAFADLVVFDPATVIDRGTFTDPNRYPEGFDQVFVNGVQVVREGKHTGAKPGKTLRRQQP